MLFSNKQSDKFIKKEFNGHLLKRKNNFVMIIKLS